MATLKTKFSVGLFLIAGITVGSTGIIWLGMSNYFEKGRFVVSYFDESVQGLEKDSPVKYRGVSIGRVQQIGVAPDERLIEVILKIESKTKPFQDSRDIVAQLSAVGITGLMFIELERKKVDEPDLNPKIEFKPPYPMVPTRPSGISMLFKGIDDIFNLFRALDTKAISEEIISTFRKVKTTLDEAQLASISNDVRDTLQHLKQLLQAGKIDTLIESIEHTSDSLNTMAANAGEGITQLRGAVAKIDTVLDTSAKDVASVTANLKESSRQVKKAMETGAGLLKNTGRQMGALQRQALITINHIDQASLALNRILDRVAGQPSQLVFSKPSKVKPAAP
ncbi:MAG: MCE family protein [Desulfobacteraceae bacterium]|nr:MCE family protein [Desulfobacteraceae bacterium]